MHKMNCIDKDSHFILPLHIYFYLFQEHENGCEEQTNTSVGFFFLRENYKEKGQRMQT